MPCSMARRAVASAVTWAAKGVDLRLPLKPWAPAEPQAITLPVESVIEMIVLLNVDWMWAWPTTTFLRSRRRVLTVFFFCLANRFLLHLGRAGASPAPTMLFGLLPAHAYRPLRASAAAPVGARALAPDGKAPAVAEPTVGADLGQPLDVHRHVA